MKIFKTSWCTTMNNKFLMPWFLLIIATLFAACRGRVPAENKNDGSISSVSPATGGEKKYIAIDTKESVVKWKGSMLIGTNSHTGYVYISKGELRMENGEPVGGTLEVDMKTIEDDNHQSDNNLIKHLKDPDFFDVKKFPVSTMVITSITSLGGEQRKVTGNLTIKGITQPVSFPVSMLVNDIMLKANGRLVIDRTRWDIRYKSGKFYDLLADQTMSDSIQFHFNIVAKK